MSDTNHIPSARSNRRARQTGTTAVEFALISLVFFTFVFGVIDVARLLYLLNTEQEVTRRAAVAAANTDFTDHAALDGVRQAAIFRTTPGRLAFSDNISDQAIRIEYMSIQRDPDGTFNMTSIPPGSLPTSPSDNRRICLLDPYCANCIRLIRVRVCDPADTSVCNRLPFRSIIPLVSFPVSMSVATTLAKAESLGLTP